MFYSVWPRPDLPECHSGTIKGSSHFNSIATSLNNYRKIVFAENCLNALDQIRSGLRAGGYLVFKHKV